MGLELDSFEKLKKGIYKAASLSERAAADLQAFSEEMITRYVEIPARELPRWTRTILIWECVMHILRIKPAMRFGEFLTCFPSTAIRLPRWSLWSRCQAGWISRLWWENSIRALDKGADSPWYPRCYHTEGERLRLQILCGAWTDKSVFLGAHYFQLNDQSCLGRF